MPRVPTSTSLSLRALLKSAATQTGMGEPAGLVTGLSAAAKALLVASAARATGNALAVLVVASDAGVEEAAADLRFFYAALEGLSDAAVERAVLPFPSHQVDPYRGLTPHLRVASARARALHAAATGSARIVVASAVALLPRLSAPERLLLAAKELRPGIEIPPLALADLLVDAGFSREDPVDEHGEFCLRGGIVDVFPAWDEQPIRLEFIGDTIESIRLYDPATQRSVGALDQALLVAIREVFDGAGPGAVGGAADRSATVFEYLSRTRAPAFFVSEDEEVRRQAAKFLEHVTASQAEAEARGHRAPAVNELLLDWDEVERTLEGATRLEELEISSEPQAPSPEPRTPNPEDFSQRSRGPTPARSRLAPSRSAWAAGATPFPGPRTPNPEPRAPSSRHIRCQPAMLFRGRIADWVAELRQTRDRSETSLFVAATPGLAERAVELMAEHALVAVPVDRGADEAIAPALLVATGRLSRGFRLPDAGFQVYTETDIFEEERKAPERRRSLARTFLSDLRDLKVGEYVVHVDHGIGVFVGLRQIGVGPGGDASQEFLELRYAGEDKLFVPVERLDLVQKYTGGAHPSVDRLGGTSWERAKTHVRKAMRDMAEELLRLYAARKAIPGHAFGADSHWQREFEDAFEYELTPDQRVAIEEIKRDMETPAPMDRLLCGDVGYGKTEVAMRAAFKSALDGKQVAFLAPTTVLAFQHLKTLKERFAAFPVRVDMVSRFRSRAEQQQILADLAAGRIDLIVGTHRLLSKDVQFRDLGLLVVDEEQRFGVAHKERIKRLRRKVDVLTMSATPIPRTLNMSLVGIRDMSIIETPPKDRLSIQTNVVKFDQQVIARAIRNELARGGQVYVVHNRVESISSIGNLITRLVPEARVVVAHGQMDERQLERAMLEFIGGRHDVLLATTIIENGLDIPNVNTIIINRADRYGLSQLYQLRGRVGRSDRPAYAYLLIPPEDSLSAVARKRLAAIKEFSDLGSGFRVAALDLEIRGAGNLLGGEQSGHIEAVGFEMYMKLLEQTVRELKGEELEDEARATVNLRVDLRIDESYVPDMNQRLMAYREVAAARSEAELQQVLDEIRDRYGPLPPSVLNLADYGRIRILADRLGIEALNREGQMLVLKFRAAQAKIDPARLVALVRERSDLMLVPPATVKLDLKAPETPERAPGRRPKGGSRGASWWTARATAGEVAPGFSKEEILKPAAEDQREPGGLFHRVEALLRQLLHMG